MFWEPGANILPALLPDGGVPPYPAYEFAVMHHPARFCRPDKRSAIRHVLRARVEHPARFLPDGGVALSGLRDRSHASPGTVL